MDYEWIDVTGECEISLQDVSGDGWFRCIIKYKDVLFCSDCDGVGLYCGGFDDFYRVSRDGSRFRIERRVEIKERWEPKLGDKVRHSTHGVGFTIVGQVNKRISRYEWLLFNPNWHGGHNGTLCNTGGPVPGFPNSHKWVAACDLSPDTGCKTGT